MKLVMFGLSHHTAPVEVRELFAFSKGETLELLRTWSDRFADCELVPVSTCNRLELYLAPGGDTVPDSDELFRFLCERKRGAETGSEPVREECAHYFQRLEDGDAAEHLFETISSLDSMVPGEPQILAQVKAAYMLAEENGTTGPTTHAAFQTALRVAKRIASETELFHHRVSIPSVAVVDFALHLFERLSDKKTVVCGAGEMARETLRYLVDNGATSITIVNRSPERAQALADEFKGTVADWDARADVMSRADIVVAATSAAEYIYTATQYKSGSARRTKPIFMLDLCVPRNLDPALARFPEVYLYSIDDLREACERNGRARDREIPRAKRITRQETELYLQESRRRDSGEVIRQLRQTWNAVKEEELRRLFNKCPGLDGSIVSEIRYTFDRMVNKLLHPPMESLKDESVSGVSHRLLEAMRRLFRL